MSQYVAEVGKAAAALDAPPILVGHSMGGYAVQRYLEDNDAAAGVLVASVPWRGTLRPNVRAARRHPGPTILSALLLDYSRMVRSVHLVRELFFTPATPQSIVDATTERLQNESALAMTAMAMRRIRPAKITTPMHVIGAEDDAAFTVDEQRELAAIYGGEVEVLPGGHDVMLDSSWPQLAASLLRIADSIA